MERTKKEAIALSMELWAWRRDHPLAGDYNMDYDLYCRLTAFSDCDCVEPLCAVFQDNSGVCHGCPLSKCFTACPTDYSEATDGVYDAAIKALETLSKEAQNA